MPLDFNDAAPAPAQREPQPPIDLDELSEALAATAERWVPELFPHGRIEQGALRLANINGDAPRKTGSCIIQLTGEHAGSYYDHSFGRGGAPLATLKDGLGYGLAEWRELAERYGGWSAAQQPRAKKRDAEKNRNAAAFALSGGTPAPGTPVETYLAARGLDLPPSPDLLFHPSLTYWDAAGAGASGKPAMIALVRLPDGAPTGGVHRTWLRDDGGGHIGKKSLGPIDSGVIMLAPIGADGTLAVGEGIETTLAGMQLYGIHAGWAAISSGGMRKLGRWLGEHHGAPLALRRLVIFADAGPDGESSAAELRARAELAGVAAEVRLPQGGDDFADDLAKGLAKGLAQAAAQVAAQVAEPELIAPPTFDLAAAINALVRDSAPAAIATALRRLALAQLDKIAESQALDQIRLRTRLKAKIIEAEYKTARRELGLEARDVQPRQGWLSKMALWDSGEPKPILLNLAIAFREAPELAGILGYDEFSSRIVLRQRPPWEPGDEDWRERRWADADELRATEWIQAAGIHAPPEAVFRAAELVAGENVFHPVREYLASLTWDRQARIDQWLSYYLGVDDAPFSRAAGACWLISAVARVMRPGIKADCALILEGDQGIGKSKALRVIGDPAERGWFTDEISDLGSKDAAMQMRGVWIIEMAELNGISRADVASIKAFLGRGADHYRPPYGRQVVDVPRHCIFGGSVNDAEYLRDETGARRFWPVRCAAIDVDSLWRDREQLWAEAMQRFSAGAVWWLRDDEVIAEAAEAQDQRRQADAWEELIGRWLAGIMPGNDVTTGQILTEALGIVDRAKWSRGDQMRVANCLRRFGWATHKRKLPGTQIVERVYRRVEV